MTRLGSDHGHGHGHGHDFGVAMEEIEALVAGTHVDPHQILGRHCETVRTWRPGADGVTVIEANGTRHESVALNPAGLFAAPGVATADYRLDVAYPSGTFEIDDPYRFWPTVGELDLHLLGEGRHERLWERMGAHLMVHQGVVGVAFSVWAPNARAVRVVGDFNQWDGRLHPMRTLGTSGVWEIFVPGVPAGSHYKFELVKADGSLGLKTDPFAFATEAPPGTAAVVHIGTHRWGDEDWMARRASTSAWSGPMAVYECHLGSWRRVPEDGDRPFTYLELAEALPSYLVDLGFTHVELLPVAEHPFTGSWGYQVTGYFAPTARFGTPDDFRALVDALHQAGIGVIVDWVPAHFPRDDFALARFDGTALYEHEDPRQGEHPDWGTLVFNYGRQEVANFLTSNALFWIEELHIDGLRVDAVASMLYLDYSRKPGEWVPNRYGGRENIEAVGFLRRFNELVYGTHPDVITMAEESTAWPGVSRPTNHGGLGFGFKWNMGWMHDSLRYFARDPIHRRHHHDDLTFGLLYAFSENFVLPLSHDEVVHGKGSLLGRMAGDGAERFSNLRALLAWMWAHPGKQVLFMGGEFGQWREWAHDAGLDWHLLDHRDHRGIHDLVRALNREYRGEPAMWEHDFDGAGFRWLEGGDADANVLAFSRFGDGSRSMVCVANLSGSDRRGYRVGLPEPGPWKVVLDTQSPEFGGWGPGGNPTLDPEATPWQGAEYSALVDLSALQVLWLARP